MSAKAQPRKKNEIQGPSQVSVIPAQPNPQVDTSTERRLFRIRMDIPQDHSDKYDLIGFRRRSHYNPKYSLSAFNMKLYNQYKDEDFMKDLRQEIETGKPKCVLPSKEGPPKDQTERLDARMKRLRVEKDLFDEKQDAICLPKLNLALMRSKGNILPHVTEMEQEEVRARDNVDHSYILELESQLKVSNILD